MKKGATAKGLNEDASRNCRKQRSLFGKVFFTFSGGLCCRYNLPLLSDVSWGHAPLLSLPPPYRHTPPSSALKIAPGPKSNCLEQVICIPEYTGVLHTSSLAGRLNKQDILCTKSPGDLYQPITQLRNESPRGVHTIFVSSVMEVLPTFIIPLLCHFTI